MGEPCDLSRKTSPTATEGCLETETKEEADDRTNEKTFKLVNWSRTAENKSK
jgi:hypothetical protein